MNSTVIAFVLALTMLVSTNAEAQRFLMSPMAEKTVVGWQYGLAATYQAKSLWSFGGFYQKDIMGETDAAPSGNVFFGVALNAPLMRSDKINFYFNTRAGLANQLFVVIVPGLETELKISRVISISSLLSVRMTYPSASIKLNIKI